MPMISAGEGPEGHRRSPGERRKTFWVAHDTSPGRRLIGYMHLCLRDVVGHSGAHASFDLTHSSDGGA